MSDLVLSIRLTADGKGLAGEVRGSAEELKKLGQAARQSNDQGRNAAEQFTASLKRQADTLGMTKSQTLAYEASQHQLTAAQREGVAQSIRAIDAYDRKQQMLTRVRLAAATAGTIIGAILVKSLKDSVVMAAEAEQAHYKLEAVLRATGNAAGWTKAQLDTLAESMKARTGIDDDKIRNSMAVMLTFRQVQTETFAQAMTMAGDLSALLGQDLQSSVLMLGKAMEDPEGGLLALRRAGVSFTDTAKDMIKEMVATGRQAEALEMILNTMRSQGIDRITESMHKGLKKATVEAGLSWDDLLKAIGQTAVIKVPVEAALGSWATYLTDMKNVIESGNWLERLAFFTAGFSSAKIVDMRKPPPPQAFQESPESVALGRQETMREHTMAQAAGLLPREGAGWEGLKKFWKEQEEAAEKARSQVDAFVKSLDEQAATLGMTSAQAAIYKAEQLGIAGAQLETVKAAAARIEQYQTEQDQLKELEAQANAERAAQANAEAALTRRAERERERMDERLEQLRIEGLTELQLITEQLDAKSALLNQALEKKAIDEEIFEARSLQILQQYERQKTQIERAESRARLTAAATAFGNLATLMQTHSHRMFNIGKAAAIAEATISTYLSAQKAFEDGVKINFWVGVAYAAAATVAGLVRIQAIKSASFGGGGAVGVFSANPATGVPNAPLSGTETAPPPLPQAAPRPTQIDITLVGRSFSAEDVRELIEQINEQQSFGAHITVTQSLTS